MRGTTWIRAGILAGLIAVSLALYWVARAGNTTLEIVFLSLLGTLALAAVWRAK